MRTTAQIEEVPVPIEGDGLALGDVLEADDLDVLAPLGHDPPDLLAVGLAPFEFEILSDDPGHLLLDLLEVLGFEGPRETEVVLVLLRVVLAPGVDRRARPQPLDRIGEHVLGGMADHVACLGVLGGDDREERHPW